MALRIGISEFDFWEMTIGEVVRAEEAYEWNQKERQKEKAIFSYKLADMIGLSVARLLGEKDAFPKSVESAYPNLFNDNVPNEKLENKEKAKDKPTMDKSAINFLQFATNFNARKNKLEEV